MSTCCHAGHDCPSKHLARLHKNCIESTDSQELVTLNPPPGVKHQNGEAFAIRVEIRPGGDMQPPILHRLLWRVAQEHLLGHRTFPERSNLVFLRIKPVHTASTLSQGYTGRVSCAPRNAARTPFDRARQSMSASFWSLKCATRPFVK